MSRMPPNMLRITLPLHRPPVALVCCRDVWLHTWHWYLPKLGDHDHWCGVSSRILQLFCTGGAACHAPDLVASSHAGNSKHLGDLLHQPSSLAKELILRFLVSCETKLSYAASVAMPCVEIVCFDSLFFGTMRLCFSTVGQKRCLISFQNPAKGRL